MSRFDSFTDTECGALNLALTWWFSQGCPSEIPGGVRRQELRVATQELKGELAREILKRPRKGAVRR